MNLKMKQASLIFFVICLLLPALHLPALQETEPAPAPAAEKPSFKVPTFGFKGKVLNRKDIGTYDQLFIDGKEVTGDKITVPRTGNVKIVVVKDGVEYPYSLYAINGLFTLLPPIVAIALALIFKDVVLSLFLGIFTGALFLNQFDVFGAFLRVMDKYVLEALMERERASIILFTLLLGGMVGVINKSGGVKGIVDKLTEKVKSAQTTQFYTWLMGILIFFDDYTNTLVVGNTMRPLSDRWKISREKLAYIVDSTAAPVCSLALISTWIGFEISLINQSLAAYGVKYDAYRLFLSSLPYRFYPLLAMLFVFLVFTLNRDFGPMLKAERRARKGKLLKDNAIPLSDFESAGLAPAEGTKARWYNGLIPILVVIFATFIGLYFSGKDALAASGNVLANRGFFSIIFSAGPVKNLGTIISSADSFSVLIWSSFSGLVTAMVLAAGQKLLKLQNLVSAMVQGMKSMMMAIMILVLAWTLGVLLVELNTADYLVSLLSSSLQYQWFPAIVFILSGIIAFSTGTSWGTISIMYPLVIPMTVILTRGTPDMEQFLILTISSVLAGAVFGDHCSPISDTTIMSSMASSCDHIDHVKTQIPYALLTAAIALFIGILPVSYGFPYIISLALAVSIAVGVLLFFGKRPTEIS